MAASEALIPALPTASLIASATVWGSRMVPSAIASAGRGTIAKFVSRRVAPLSLNRTTLTALEPMSRPKESEDLRKKGSLNIRLPACSIGAPHGSANVFSRFVGQGFTASGYHKLDKHQHGRIDLPIQAEAMDRKAISGQYAKNVAEQKRLIAVGKVQCTFAALWVEFNYGLSRFVKLVSQTQVLKPGQMWRIPGGVVHGCVAGDQAAKAIDVFHPVREDYR